MKQNNRECMETYPNLLINADDFGLSEPVNEAIVRAWKEKTIFSTTILANMPGFDDAVKRIKNGDIPVDRIGIHLNLFEGRPLTPAMQECKIFCNQHGVFHKGKISLFAPKSCQKIIFAELDAQMRKVLDNGIKITHIDSHAHRHINWFIGKQVIELAKKYHINQIRVAGNLNITTLKKKIYTWIYNNRLGKYAYSDYFSNILVPKKCLQTIPSTKKIEIMIHPVINETGNLVDAEFNDDLNMLIKNLL